MFDRGKCWFLTYPPGPILPSLLIESQPARRNQFPWHPRRVLISCGRRKSLRPVVRLLAGTAVCTLIICHPIFNLPGKRGSTPSSPAGSFRGWVEGFRCGSVMMLIGRSLSRDDFESAHLLQFLPFEEAQLGRGVGHRSLRLWKRTCTAVRMISSHILRLSPY
jgi:hypothetical protein